MLEIGALVWMFIGADDQGPVPGIVTRPFGTADNVNDQEFVIVHCGKEYILNADKCWGYFRDALYEYSIRLKRHAKKQLRRAEVMHNRALRMQFKAAGMPRNLGDSDAFYK